MKCQRCGADTRVRTHRVDSYRGYLCEACREKWEQLAESAP